MFESFKKKLAEGFKILVVGQDTLYVTDVDRDTLWNAYLNGFPEEERQEHNCNCCRQFIKPFANVVIIKDNKPVSIWEFGPELEYPWKEVAEQLATLVKGAPIRDVFVTHDHKFGTDFSHQMLPDGTVKRWNHLQIVLPSQFVSNSGASNEAIMSQYKAGKEVFKRSLEEISKEAVETVLELIDQKSLYRGEESKEILKIFLNKKKEYLALPDAEKDYYCWKFSKNNPVAKIRNTAIGTLLTDISEGKELDVAVAAFERIMAPANYKRPNAVLTKGMIEQAEKKIIELGFENSLGRRFAHLDDITVNNVLFINNASKKALGVFDALKAETAVNPQSLSKVEEIGIEDFVKTILPKIESMELLMENKFENNLFSLIAPENKEAPSMLKWNNNFSWTYNNDVTDSMKERVKAAGGDVTGVLRFSIQWNEDGKSIVDLDAHAHEPGGQHIHYANYCRNRTPQGGMLDVDMRSPRTIGVENITWNNRSQMKMGKYRFSVHNYNGGNNNGFRAQIEFDGQIFEFTYDKQVMSNQFIQVAEVDLSSDGFSLIPKLPASAGKTISKDIWGIKTNQFQKVSLMMYSPNYWDEQVVGNKHYFFVLEGCKNPDTPRGFFNEYLKQELMEQKRVFEALGSKMKVEPSDNQLSGVGFSSTTKPSLICKVTGTFNRTLKINF